MIKRCSLWPDAAIIIILTLLPGLFFWRLITPNPADQMQLAAGDFTGQYFPLRAFAAGQWVRGQLPLWNPYLSGGQPALADIQSGALYPVHVLQALLLGWGGPLFGYQIGFPLWALEWQAILHFSIAAVGTYLFARHLMQTHGAPLRQARFAGVTASLVFTYGGYLTGFPVQQLTILEVSAWLPWVLWGLSAAYWRLAAKRGEWANGELRPSHKSSAPARTTHYALHTAQSLLTPPTALAALAFALAILAGHPQTVMYIVYFILAYTLFFAFYFWRNPLLITNYQLLNSAPLLPRSSAPLRPLLQRLILHTALWLLTTLLGAAVAAAQLLPTLELIRRSVRADLSFDAVSAGLPLTELVSILYPGFFGGSPEYVGIVTLALIALALALGHPRGFVYFWAGAALVSLLLAFGRNLFVYPVFYLLAPGFDSVRQQERVFLIYSFSAAMLAGYGAAALVSPLSKAARQMCARFEQRLRLVFWVALGLTAFFIYGATAATARGDQVNLFLGVLRHHILGLIFLGGMLLLLALRRRRRLHRWWGMALLAGWVAFNLFTVNWRFNLQNPADSPPFAPNGVVQFLQTNLQSPNLPPGRISSGGLLPGGNSAASVYGLEDLTGNTPLQLAAVDTFLRQMPSWRLWQLMNARYIVEQRDIAGPGLTPVFSAGELTVFEMGDPFERVWLVWQVEVVADLRQTIERLADDSFDLRRAAIVPAPLTTPLDDASDSTATIVAFSPTRLAVQVEATGPHLLVLSQIYDPGWQASVDGQPARLLRVNGVQQGVLIPAGRHRVDVTYWPASFRLGSIISMVGLVTCGVLLLAGRFTLFNFRA